MEQPDSQQNRESLEYVEAKKRAEEKLASLEDEAQYAMEAVWYFEGQHDHLSDQAWEIVKQGEEYAQLQQDSDDAAQKATDYRKRVERAEAEHAQAVAVPDAALTKSIDDAVANKSFDEESLKNAVFLAHKIYREYTSPPQTILHHRSERGIGFGQRFTRRPDTSIPGPAILWALSPPAAESRSPRPDTPSSANFRALTSTRLSKEPTALLYAVTAPVNELPSFPRCAPL